MAELLSAGVFIEERQTDAQVVEAVSTSNMGIVGFSPKGPTDTARLVTSLDEYFQVFGGLSKKSLMGTSVLAFFQNGGRRCFVVRVMPSDAVQATGQVQSQVTGQLLATGDGTATSYTGTDTTSTLLDASGLAPLVPGSLTLRYRAAGTAVTGQSLRNAGNSAMLQTLTGVKAYAGRIDPKATLVVAGASSPDGDVLYRSVADGNTAVTVTHVVAGVSTPLSVSVTGSAITVTVATDGSSAATSTATQIATAVNANTAAAALVSATALGAGSAVTAAVAVTALKGIPVFENGLFRVIPGTVTVSWTISTVGKTIALAYPADGSPVGSKTTADGTFSIDYRTGRVSLLLTGTPVIGDNAKDITIAYTPASATKVLTSGTSVDTGLVTPADAGKTLLAGSTLAAPTLTNNYVNVQSGAYLLTFSAGAGNIPHQRSPILASYKTDAWGLTPISKGAWANDVRLSISGTPDSYAAATASYGSFTVRVQVKNADTGVFEIAESYEEVSFTDSASATYFPDVLNQLSDLVNVVDPGSDMAPAQLAGRSTTYVLGGGDKLSSDVLATAIVEVSANAVPVAPRTVSITYTQASDSAVRTITDDGNGNLTGAVDASYATTSSTGLGANKINYATGEVNFKPISPALAGTLITMAYYTTPDVTTLTEQLGDAAKAHSYVVGTTTYAYYRAGSDGTFDAAHFSSAQFSSVALQPTLQGLYAFDRIDEILQLAIPDFAGDATVAADQIAYAESRASLPHGGDRFVLLVPPRGSDAQAAVDWVRYALAVKSKYAAVYWPWVKVNDPLNNNRPTVVPPLGHIAGIYARTDRTRNVGKAPAGTVDGALAGITGLELDPTQGMRDFVYPYRVNPLINSPQSGRALWGSRTLAADTSWRNINAVRLFMFVEKSIFNSTHWIVFEPNGPSLWSRIKTQLVGFLTNLFNDSYFAGKSPSAAFFVVVDETNNSAASVDLGETIIDVGIAPNKPAEFIRFRFQQKTAS